MAEKSTNGIKMRKVLVTWLDSNTLHGWQYGEYDTNLPHCESIGFVKQDDFEKLVLVQSTSDYGAHMNVTVIPKACIKSVRELRIK